MNTRECLIIIKDKIKTSEVKKYQYNHDTQKMDITFQNGSVYSYLCDNVQVLKNPDILNPAMYHISRAGKTFFDISGMYVFHGAVDDYWHICFKDGSERDYNKKDLVIEESVLNDNRSANVFGYMKEIAGQIKMENEPSEEDLLKKNYSKITFIGKESALESYFGENRIEKSEKEYFPIFPFGCNNSQYEAVKNAMENQLSIIEGPPGTGKTQTILNIIANILMNGKTVQVVSNNNSAIQNVYEKLSSSKYNLGFIVASLGKSDNKKKFIEKQSEYPDFSSWKLEEDSVDIINKIHSESIELKTVFDKQEKLAVLRQKQLQLSTEYKYFEDFIKESKKSLDIIKIRKKLSSKYCMDIWQECQFFVDSKRKISLLFRLKLYFKYGISSKSFYKQNIDEIIMSAQKMFYITKNNELQEQIIYLENELDGIGTELLDNMQVHSMQVLKDNLAVKYKSDIPRKKFSEDDLWKNSNEFVKEYPVILSTTFSSRNSLNSEYIYDYVIMDEASQVDVATGVLALSCAKNAVIVGDTRQLSNVVKKDFEKVADEIFDKYDISQGYHFTKSFLQSVIEVIPDVTKTMLREHYRCHPKIINFCNQKFYKGELVIMTEDKGEDDVLAVVKTVKGNHERKHYSQRQIDVIKEEVIPKYVSDQPETGIISPYKNQVYALNEEIKGMDIATVHKFQGREKDTIIISTVDDTISEFTDKPDLINVAVSRAKKKLILVVTGNELTNESNIKDLMNYIEYNNFEIYDSKVYSIFDYLYKQYADERKEFLKKHKSISDYDSENLMYVNIEKIFKMEKYSALDVITHIPLKQIIRNYQQLSNKEIRYLSNPATHVDFLIYNRISKKVVLVIEVDGVDYHTAGTKQAERDMLKNHILELAGLSYIRTKTNGSMEKERIMAKLDMLI